jgi:hypothetical protein
MSSGKTDAAFPLTYVYSFDSPIYPEFAVRIPSDERA